MIYKTNESIIVIQAEAVNPIQTGVVFWSYDRGTAKLRFKLQKDGVNQNLPEGTTVPIRLIFKSATAQGGYGKHDYLATIEDRLNGVVSIVLEDNILGYQGRVDGSIYIDFPNDQSLDTAGRFSFSIKRSPIDDSTPELENYYFNGFSQTIDKIEKMIADAKAEIDAKAAETKKEFDTELENVKTSITKAEASLSTMNKDMTVLEEKITEADQHFVSKESVEKGPLIFKNTSITTEDWNDITASGIYYCAAATGKNMPYTGKLYGFLTVYNELAVIIQKYEFGSNIYRRTFAGSPATWGSWIKIANANEVVSLTEPQEVQGLKNFSEGLQIGGINGAVEYAKAVVTNKYENHGAVYLGGCVWLAWETLGFENTAGYAKGSSIRIGSDGNAAFTYGDVPNIFGGYLWIGGTCQPDYTNGGFASYHITVENNFDDARKPIVRFIDSPSTPVKKVAVRGFALVFAPAPTQNSKVEQE